MCYLAVIKINLFGKIAKINYLFKNLIKPYKHIYCCLVPNNSKTLKL